MNRERLLTIGVIVLLILNLGTLGFLFLSRAPRQGPPPAPQFMGRGPMMRPDELIRSTLQLTEDQDAKYVESIGRHHVSMMHLDSEFRLLADRYFGLLRTSTPATGERDSLLAAIGRTQSGKAEATYKHFAEIKAICTSEQASKFDSIIPELTKMLLSPQARSPHGPPPHAPSRLPPPPRDERGE